MKFRFLRYKTRSYLKNNKTPRFNEAYQKAVSIGVIFTVEDRAKHDHVKTLIRRLEHDGKKVKSLAYLPPHQENYEFLFDFFTYREISFWGTITASSAVTFAETPFDFLVYLDTTPNELILNIIARSKAKCRIGRMFLEAEPFFEMMVESRGDSHALIDEIHRYMTSLR